VPDGVSDSELEAILDDVAHCPAYFQLLVKATLLPGLLELAHTPSPRTCDLRKGPGLPAPRSHRYFQAQLPAGTRITELDGVGHIPMFEAPSRVTEAITAFLEQHSIDEHSWPLRAVEDPPAS